MTEKVHIPEVIEAEEKLPQDLVALRKFAFLMDEAFTVPGTRFRFGVDALVGLIPGLGDVVGGVLSTWILVGAVRHRVPATVIARMTLNILIDLFFGAVPVAGDVFDFLWEENMKNMRLLEKHRNRRREPRSAAVMAVIGVVILVILVAISLSLVAAIIALIVWILRNAGIPS